MLADTIREHIQGRTEDKRITDVRMGLRYTGVRLEDGNVGVAYTFTEKLPHGCGVLAGGRPIAGKDAHTVIDYLGSGQLLESSLGLATANALINRACDQYQQGDILETITLDKDDRVGMVGFFGPLVSPLREKVRELLIFERVQRGHSTVLPAEQAIDTLPQCDVALITSTSLVNSTMDQLLEAAAGICREVVLLGASTLLLPPVFRPLGVTVLSGVVVTDSAGMLQAISEGGGTRSFREYTSKVNIRL